MDKMRFSFSGATDDLSPLKINPVVLNMHSTGTDDELMVKCTWASLLRIGMDFS